MSTIKEIAALAGVSRGTVDRVLNNRGSVNPATAEKIREIAKALDYRPNLAGLVLAAQKKKLKLGIILLSTENPFFVDVEQGVTEKAEELSGYNCTVVVKYISYGAKEQLHAIDELVEEEVNGIALPPYNDESIRERINQLHDLGIPVVTFNTDIENSKRLAYVGSNYIKSGETAAGLMHLMGDSFLRIGIITGSPDMLCHTERISGFVNTLKKYKSDIDVVEIIENHDDEFESYEKTTNLLKQHPEINALFFAAGGVYGGCRSLSVLGLEKKVTVITFDKVPTTKELVKKGVISATICQQPKIQGSKPLAILFNYLTTGEKPEKEYNHVAVDIRIRENI